MNTRRLDDCYPALDPVERFRLAMRAGARDDEHEFRRLVETCPTQDYRETDAAYLDRVRAARDMVVTVLEEVRCHFEKARALRAGVDAAQRVCIVAVETALLDVFQGREDRPEVSKVIGKATRSGENLTATLEDGIEEAQRRAAAPWHAFSALCRDDMRLEPRTVIAGCGGSELASIYDAAFDELEATTPEPKLVTQWHELFARWWARATAEIATVRV